MKGLKKSFMFLGMMLKSFHISTFCLDVRKTKKVIHILHFTFQKQSYKFYENVNLHLAKNTKVYLKLSSNTCFKFYRHPEIGVNHA